MQSCVEFSKLRKRKAKMVNSSCYWVKSDMLVANQFARLSSVEVVILSERFAPGIDLSSSVVRDVLRG